MVVQLTRIHNDGAAVRVPHLLLAAAARFSEEAPVSPNPNLAAAPLVPLDALHIGIRRAAKIPRISWRPYSSIFPLAAEDGVAAANKVRGSCRIDVGLVDEAVGERFSGDPAPEKPGQLQVLRPKALPLAHVDLLAAGDFLDLKWTDLGLDRFTRNIV